MSLQHSARLQLHPVAVQDAAALFAIQGQRDHMRYTTASPSLAWTQAWLQRQVEVAPQLGYSPWTLRLRSSGEVVGWGGLWLDLDMPDWGTEVAYFITPALQGQGYATELVRAALHCGFGELGLARVTAFAHRDNPASQRVLLKCGFEPLGYEARIDRLEFRCLTPHAAAAHNGGA